MIARVFALVRGKGTQWPPLNRSMQASSAFRSYSHMLQQFSFLHRRSCTFESNWTMQNKFSPTENPDVSSPVSIKDTVRGNFDQRFEILRSIGECINEDDLSLLLKKKNVPTCYVWCDPSPTMHISQGITMTINVNKLVKAGCKVKILMADWGAHINHKIGGNLRKNQDICSYNIEMWKSTGMYLDRVEFVQLSDEISCRADQYWPLAMDIARKTKLSEIKKCLHLSKDTRLYGTVDPYVLRELSSAEIVFTCLQSAAMLSHKVDMWLLDIGQRAGNMVATQYCKGMMSDQPISLFHNVLPSLLEHPEMEMWGDPRWAIFMEDTEIDVGRAMRKAFCPLRIAESNPCLEYIKHIIFPLFGKFEVLRKEENGGNKMFLSMADLTVDYESGALQPADVKQALEKAMNMTLQPIRDHFANSAEAKKLLKAIQG